MPDEAPWPQELASVGQPAPGSGSTSDWLTVRSDGTLMRGAPPQVSVDAWGAVGDGVTDDTAAFNNSQIAANAKGAAAGLPIQAYLTPGKTYALGELAPLSYCEWWGYGAAIKRAATYSINHAVFTGGSVTRFSVRGFTMIGTGAEQYHQGIVYVNQLTHAVFEDNITNNVTASIFDVRDCQYIWINRNRLTNPGVANQTNAINIRSGVNGSTMPTKHIWVTNNVLTGVGSEGITLWNEGTTGVRTDPEIDAHITGNYVQCVPTAGAIGWPIAVEWNGPGVAPPNVSGIDISGNRCVTSGAIGSNTNFGIVITQDGTQSNDPLCISEVTVTGNTISVTPTTTGTVAGILSCASRITISGNEIISSQHDIYLQGHGTAVPHHITIGPNTGGYGTGDRVHITNGGWDYATLSVTGNTPTAPPTPTVPASGTAVSAAGYNRIFYTTAAAGGCTMTLQDGKAIVVPATTLGAVRIPAGWTVTPTYTNAPTWIVEGE